MKKGDIVDFKDPFPEELGLKLLLIEDPDGDRVLAEAMVDLIIRPSYVVEISELRLVLQDIQPLIKTSG